MYRDPALYFIDTFIAIDKIKRYTKNILSLKELMETEAIEKAKKIFTIKKRLLIF